MLIVIPILSCLLFGALYPLCFLIFDQQIFKSGFTKFNLGLTNFVTGLGVVILLFSNIPAEVKFSALLWKVILWTISYRSWKKGEVSPLRMFMVTVVGLCVTLSVFKHFTQIDPWNYPVIILGGTVLCASIFTMNMGHWYLNVPGVPIVHLIKATKVFLYVLMARSLWGLYALFSDKIIYYGDSVPLYQFLLTSDGILLLIAFLFGTLAPLVFLYFVFGTLKVKSTQSATGILYVIVALVLMGDLSYKFIHLRYHLVL